MERVLLAIVNWINIIQEIVEGSKKKKIVPVSKGVITIKFSLYKILTKIPTKLERLDFRKT